MGLNKIFLVGNVGSIDVKTVGGNKVANFSLATSERFKNKDGETTEKTTWHSVQVWGKTAEYMERYVTKGTLLFVEGKLECRKYTDRNGDDRTVYEVRADGITNLSPRQGEKPDMPF